MPNQFIVPQFIDVEDKVIGPISVRQFIFMLIGTGLIVGSFQLLYRMANQPAAFFLTAFGILCGIILFSFVKVNGRPFHLFVLNVLQSVKNPRMRIWNNQVGEQIRYRHEPPPPAPIPVKQTMTQTKLAQLALLIDTGGAYHEDQPTYWGQNLPNSPTSKTSNTSPKI